MDDLKKYMVNALACDNKQSIIAPLGVEEDFPVFV